MENTTLTKNAILSELSKSPHGKYEEYLPVGVAAAKQEPEFFARLIAWNRDNGEVRDSKVALPVVSLSVPSFNDKELVENSLAHLALLDPRNLVKAARFAKQVKTPGQGHAIARLVERYLRYREADWKGRFEPTAVRYKTAIKELYALYRVACPVSVSDVLFGGVKGGAKVKPVRGSVFEGVGRLKDMGVSEAAGFIASRRIPFLTAKGALGERIKEPDILRALVERMSPTELVTNAKELEKLGMKNLPAVRGAFDAAMTRAATSTRNVLKTTQAVEAVEDEALKERLRGLQERQIANVATIEGDWAVLGDKSGSMAVCIEAARRVAGTLAKLVKGKVYLIFFDSTPKFIDVTGMSYDGIKVATRFVNASGGTSIGCGLQYLLDRKIAVNGIAVVSDAQENALPCFAERYLRYKSEMGVDPPVYLYRCGTYKERTLVKGASYVYSMHTGDKDMRDTCKECGIDVQEFQLGTSVDAYSIPDLAKTMTTTRYGLIDKVMNTPLITLEMVFDGKFNERTKKRGKKTYV